MATSNRKKTQQRRGATHLMATSCTATTTTMRCIMLIATLYLASQLTYAQEPSALAAISNTTTTTLTANGGENQSSTTTTRVATTSVTELSSSSSSSPASLPDLAATTTTSVPEDNEKSSPLAPVATSNETKQTPAPTTAKNAPVLRPSIEEVASELSRKYLNLERHQGNKQSTTASAATTIGAQEAQPAVSRASTLGPAARSSGSSEQQETSQAEHDIELKGATYDLSSLRSTSPGPSRSQSHSHDGTSVVSSSANEANSYLHVDAAAAAAAAASRPRAASSSSGGGSARRKKLLNGHLVAYLQGAPSSEDTELFQCQQYLQRHSTAYQALVSSVQDLGASGGGAGKYSYSASQLLPCSCQQTSWHFASPPVGQSLEGQLNIDRSRVWLNCDNIQLIGSQLFTPFASSGGGGSNGTNQEDKSIESAITKLSQRDAGLQVLFSQKFHYLQLSALRSLDLSQNRLRQIKLDAFHGLENSLEFLNLANNLLGDSRAIFDEGAAAVARAQHSGAHQTHNIADNHHQNQNNIGKLTFYCDELNRLKKLKWLSLASNQINQLGSSVFVSTRTTSLHQQTISTHQDAIHAPPEGSLHQAHSELLYLDLSDNLLKSIPSNSIATLNRLQVLRLNKNKIIQLDQTSKFPASLKYLDLSENLISTIRQSDLIDLQNLIELNLSNNQLRHLDQSAFISASALVQAPSNSLVQPTHLAGASPKDAGSPGSSDQDQTLTRKLVPSDTQDSKIGEQSESVQSAASYDQPEARLKRRRRRRREIKQTDNEVEEDLVAEESSSSGDDLEADESIFSALTGQFKSAPSTNQQQQQQQILVASEDVNMPTLGRAGINSQFNSTLKLNLSYNFFENVPGDSLLKFSHLQSLDLSNNRIRKLDSNYLCSIYNLVENLRHIDLSGNLLTLDQQQQASGDNHARHINKLFGCLQRLEKLALSTNRLVATSSKQVPTSADYEETIDVFRADSDDHPNQGDGTIRREDTVEQSSQQTTTTQTPNVRLTIKFGENYGSKMLNTLDLSDNQLRLFPLIEQVIQQPSIVTNDSSSSSHQAQLNQWMSSRVHLEVLNLNYNYLERLDGHEFEHLYNLQQLHMNSNKLSALPARIMRRFTSLDRLSLAGNQIVQLEPLNELLERSMRTLRVLNLANNRLASWPQMNIPLASAGASPALNGDNHQLIAPELRLASNGAMEPVPLDGQQQTMAGGPGQQHNSAIDMALEDLNLEGNLLTSLNITTLFDQLIYMKALKSLNLNYNLLNRIQSEWFKYANRNLQRLSLTGNKINSIDLGAFALNQVNELLTLNLDYNLLRELRRKTFDSMPKIRELNLGHNLIHTINSETFHQLNSLQVLRLNNNKLTSWKCEYFSYLCNSISGQINVDLATLLTASTPAANQQQQQHPAATAPGTALSSLTELDLSHNSLSQLRANSISVHTKLMRLNLSHNKLSFIPHDLFKATTSILSGGRQIHLVSSLKYLNLAHNRIQTIDNINFKPLKNLIKLDLSYNELQSLGIDVISLDRAAGGGGGGGGGDQRTSGPNQHQERRQVMVANNLTSLLIDNDSYDLGGTQQQQPQQSNQTARSARSLYPTTSSWPALSKLRYLNLSHNALTSVNQSLLSELSPFVSLNLDLSHNYLDSDSLPVGFFTKVSSPIVAAQQSTSRGATSQKSGGGGGQQQDSAKTGGSYDLVFTLKLESLDLSHNRLGDWPASLLDSHYASMESCSLSHNRIQTLPRNSNSMIQIKRLNFEFNPLNRESSELVLFEQRSSRYLNLAATRLYAIQQATADSLQYSSQALPNGLKTLRLVNQTSQLDLIRSISRPIEAPYLRHLNLSSNQLVWLSANVFDKLHSLQTLDLSNNQLTRLHLLSNQLNQVSSSLENLNLGSNLFTSIDATDFNQLGRLRHLDLSNMLSLQKLNCRFLARLSTLRQLKMFNYPQLRHRLSEVLNNLLSNIDSQQQLVASERYQQKLQDELVMSTIGGHCFQQHDSGGHQRAQLSAVAEGPLPAYGKTWYKLEEIELELFNNFQGLTERRRQKLPIDSFQLTSELTQLLGAQTRKLTLFGLNLTTISDDSLLGVTSDQLDLKISYTSISHLPLGKILASLAKRTRLRLDLRNNNIHTIDMDALKWLDELQQNSNQQVVIHHSTTSGADTEVASGASLKLASNPFRCDCQTRPLWLWLNQRWDNLELPQASDEQLGETSTGNNANYWLKFHTISHTSDLRCFYPLKLRGKLAQHVYYNDLVCKGGGGGSGNSPSGAPPTLGGAGKSSRKRNETGTRSSDSYYLTSLSGDSNTDNLDDLEDGGDLDSDALSGLPVEEQQVRVTRFNRYPLAISNSTHLYFMNNFPSVPFVPDGKVPGAQELPSPDEGLDASNRIGKRDQGSAPASPDSQDPSVLTRGSVQPPVGDGGAARSQRENQQHHVASTKYYKHRPNTQQKHAHHSTLTNLNSVKFGRSSGSARSAAAAGDEHTGVGNKRSLLTESDIMILTVASIAMTVMAFVIMSICLFKYKLDRADEEQILRSTHSKLIMSRALFTSKANLSQGSAPGTSTQNSSSSNEGSRTSSKRSTGGSGGQGGKRSSGGRTSGPGRTSGSGRRQGSPHPGASSRQHKFSHSAIGKHQNGSSSPRGHQSSAQHQVAGPNGTSYLIANQAAAMAHPRGLFAPVVAQNFLMRSPTIRRMHGLAGNASDWFRYTLRAYPSASGSRRRRLFIQNNGVCGTGGPSQLTTAKLRAGEPPNLSSLILSGCPLHAFTSVIGEQQPKPNECLHCNTLVAAVQQTKICGGYPFTRRPVASALDQNHRRAAEAPDAAQQVATSRSPQGKQTTKEDSSEEHARSKVETSKSELASKHQQAPRSFQATIEQSGGGFMPPKMIQALAQQLDEQHQQQNRVTAGVRPFNSQAKSMKTFGASSGHSQSQSTTCAKQTTATTTTTTNTTATSSVDGGVLPQSQIPTIDVDGRFTYASDSHIDSPYAPASEQTEPETGSRSGGAQRARGGVTPASTVATTTTHQEDIFVLLRDHTPTSETTTRGSMYEDARSSQHQQQHHNALNRADDSESQTTGTERPQSSMMQDECSRTSSPVAYGFMRTSPSATTLGSSNTMTTHQSHHYQQQYVVNAHKSSHRVGDDQSSFYSEQTTTSEHRPKSLSASEQRFQLNPTSSFKTNYNNNNNNNNDNNNRNYLKSCYDENNNNNDTSGVYEDANQKGASSWAYQRQREQQHQVRRQDRQGNPFESDNEQLIISRL